MSDHEATEVWDILPEDIILGTAPASIAAVRLAAKAYGINPDHCPPAIKDRFQWIYSEAKKRQRPWSNLSKKQRVSIWRRMLKKAK